jgi:hypothetical protein
LPSRSLVRFLKLWNEGLVTFGNNDQGKIRGKGTIGNTNSAKVENVQYIKGLKHNLLIISQLCDSGFEVVFKPNICEIRKTPSNKLCFTESRKKNLYVLNLNDMPAESCFISLEKDKWIWDKRVGHISMKTNAKLS